MTLSKDVLRRRSLGVLQAGLLRSVVLAVHCTGALRRQNANKATSSKTSTSKTTHPSAGLDPPEEEPPFPASAKVASLAGSRLVLGW